MAKMVTVELSEREAVLIGVSIAVKKASVARAYNAAKDADFRALFQKQLLELNDLSRKFPEVA